MIPVQSAWLLAHVERLLAVSSLSRPLRIVRIGLGLAFTSVLARLFGMKRCWSILRRLADRPAPYRHSALSRAAVTRAGVRDVTAIAERSPFQSRCLARSLFLAALLRRQGIAGSVCIGVRGEDGFDAHAWVEIDSVPINDRADVTTRYATLWRLEA